MIKTQAEYIQDNDTVIRKLNDSPELYHRFYIKNGKVFIKDYGSEDVPIGLIEKNIINQSKILKVFCKFEPHCIKLTIHERNT